MGSSVTYSARRALISAGKRLVSTGDRRCIESAGELPRLLRTYLSKTESTGCSWSDYATLYRRIRTLRPREVLECGTGVSTVVIAYALAENAREGGEPGRVTSLEEHQGWYEMAGELLPASLSDYVDLRLSPTVETQYWLFRGMRYRDLPDRPYSFVFVDGPSTLAPSDGVKTCDLDLVHVVNNARQSVSAIVDARLRSCYVLQQIFGRRFRYDVFRDHGMLDSCNGDELNALRDERQQAFKRSRRLLGSTCFRSTF
ncbi:MAG: hypothetical protein WBN81_12100 [Gammaproteobacteria bacterium]